MIRSYIMAGTHVTTQGPFRATLRFVTLLPAKRRPALLFA